MNVRPPSGTQPGPPSAAAPPRDLERRLFPALAVAAGISLAFLGILLRAGNAAGRSPATEAVFGGVLLAGVVAFNASLLLAAAYLVLAARRRYPADPGCAGLIVAATALGLLALPLTGRSDFAVLDVGVTVVALAVLAQRASANGWRGLRLPLAVMAVFAGTAVGRTATSLGLAGGATALLAAETLAVAVAILAPLLLECRWRRVPLLVGAGAAVLFTALALRTPILPLVAQWGLGFSLALPLPLYALGVGALAYAFAERLPTTGLRGETGGLFLLALAGIGLRTSQEALIVLAGAVEMTAPAEAPEAVAAREVPAGTAERGTA